MHSSSSAVNLALNALNIRVPNCVASSMRMAYVVTEMNALTEMAGNMSQTSGTSIMLTQNAGQQVAADLSRGVVQGISGYFAKKVRTPKVTLKAGHQVFLVSKK